MIVKLTALDIPPTQFPFTEPVVEDAVVPTIMTGLDGAGVTTVTFAVAGDARSVAGMLAVNW